MLNLFANKQQLEPDLFSYRRLLGRTGAGAYSLFEGLVSFTQFLMTVSLLWALGSYYFLLTSEEDSKEGDEYFILENADGR